MTDLEPSPRKHIWKVLLPVFVIVTLAYTGLWIVKKTTAKRPPGSESFSAEVGQKVPDLDLNRISGESVKLSSLEGKVFLINFWATWCEACLVEMPSIIKLKNHFQSKGLQVLAVSVDEDPGKVVPPVVEKMKFNFPVFIDKDQVLGGLFEVYGIPHSVVLDRSRNILYIETGEKNWFSSEVIEQFDKWLSGHE